MFLGTKNLWSKRGQIWYVTRAMNKPLILPLRWATVWEERGSWYHTTGQPLQCPSPYHDACRSTAERWRHSIGTSFPYRYLQPTVTSFPYHCLQPTVTSFPHNYLQPTSPSFPHNYLQPTGTSLSYHYLQPTSTSFPHNYLQVTTNQYIIPTQLPATNRYIILIASSKPAFDKHNFYSTAWTLVNIHQWCHTHLR